MLQLSGNLKDLSVLCNSLSFPCFLFPNGHIIIEFSCKYKLLYDSIKLCFIMILYLCNMPSNSGARKEGNKYVR